MLLTFNGTMMRTMLFPSRLLRVLWLAPLLPCQHSLWTTFFTLGLQQRRSLVNATHLGSGSHQSAPPILTMRKHWVILLKMQYQVRNVSLALSAYLVEFLAKSSSRIPMTTQPVMIVTARIQLMLKPNPTRTWTPLAPLKIMKI